MARWPREEDRIVFSTDSGRHCPGCGEPVAACRCTEEGPPEGDGIARVRPEKKGRGGKVVTTITGLPLAKSELAALAKELKKRVGTGGSAKDGVITIQGDHVDLLVAELERRGHAAKRSGG